MKILRHPTGKANWHYYALILAMAVLQLSCNREEQGTTGIASLSRAQARLAEPASDDLVLFIAEFQPTLYRLVGSRPVPWGDARFYSPASLIADARRQCFYVLDLPMRAEESFKIWKVDSHGRATVIYVSPSGPEAPGHSWIQGLGLDSDNLLLLADAGSGLWRLELNGQMRQVIASKDPVSNITATSAGPGGGLFVASSYQHQVVSRDILVGTIHSQGGLFRMNPGAGSALECLINNQRPGAPAYDTHWRQVRQILHDTGDRLLLVDAGTKKAGTGTTEINGGVLVYHPHGQLEDLTFKTSQQNSGPLRHPRGIAQWTADSYIVADPGMVAEGVNGTGGLLLLALDGRREARWPFGYRLRPCGVALLRGVQAAPAPKALPMDAAAVAGTYAGGELRIGNLKWERQKTTSYPPGHPLYGLDVISGMMTPLEDREAQERLRSIVMHMQWIIAPDGSFRLEASTGTISGTWKANGDQALATAAYVKQGAFDMKTYSLDAMVTRTQPGQLQASVSFTYMDKKERVIAGFEQILLLR